MSTEYKDRFTEADKEQENHSPFVCESCRQGYTREAAEKKDMACCGRTLRELTAEGFGP